MSLVVHAVLGRRRVAFETTGKGTVVSADQLTRIRRRLVDQDTVIFHGNKLDESDVDQLVAAIREGPPR